MTIKVGKKEYYLDGYTGINELQKLLVECYRQGEADEREKIKNKMESLWGTYLNNKSNVPRPDFMSAYVLICLEENNDKGV